MDIVQVEFGKIEHTWKIIEQLIGVTLFQTYDFHRIWLTHFGKNLNLHILQTTDGGEVVGIAPFILNGSTLEFIITQKVLGEELVSDYGDILFQQGKEQMVWNAIISYAKENGYGLKLDFVRESSASYRILTTYNPQPTTLEIDVAPFLALSKTWDEYLANLSRHNRQELRRKMKKLTDVRLAYVEPTGENLSTLFNLMRQSGEDKVRFLKPEMEAFFTELITFFHTEKSGKFVFLYQNEMPIAAVVGFIFNSRWYLYNSGYRANLRQLSPGVVLKGLLIKDAIEKGIEVFDFLRGNERYKYNLGGVEEKLYTIAMPNYK